MRRIGIYFATIIALLLPYSLFIIPDNTDKASIYPLIVWNLSALVVYPIISLIAGVVLLVVLRDRKGRTRYAIWSGIPVFIISVITYGSLLSFREEDRLQLSLGGSLVLTVEVIIIQMVVIGIAKVCYTLSKNRKI